MTQVQSRGGDPDRRMIRKAMNTPLLEAEEETALARAWKEKGDEKALHELTVAYMRLVAALASKFRQYGLPYGDLVQEGAVGLMQAAERFDPDRGVRFSTYASWWVRASIQNYVLRNWSIVRTGTTSAHKSLFFNLRRLRARIGDTDEILSPESRAAIAKELGVSEDDVELMAGRLSGADPSLNAPMNGEDGAAARQDFLLDERETPEESYMSVHDSVWRNERLRKAMDTALNDRERFIIARRRLQEDGETLASLGKLLDLSKERVRQIEAQAFAKLKAALTEEAGDARESGLIPAA